MKERVPLALLYTILFCLLMTPFIGFAQTSAEGMTAKQPNSKAMTVSDTRKQVSVHRKAFKKLPALHNGYFIEVEASNYPLDNSEAVFQQFGNVFYEKLPSGGYSYGIKVDFSSLDAIKEYLNNNVIFRAPKARIILYKKGKRSLVK